jgi:hypothetical protein
MDGGKSWRENRRRNLDRQIIRELESLIVAKEYRYFGYREKRDKLHRESLIHEIPMLTGRAQVMENGHTRGDRERG